MNKLVDAKLFLFDLDGTVYHDGALIGDAKKSLEFLRDNGYKIVYLTNNSSVTKLDYEKKLKGVGILEKDDIIYSSLDCAIDFFNKFRAGKKVYALATEKVKEYLKDNGLNLVDDEVAHSADILLLTFDKELDYNKIVIANELLVLGKEYISTHPDKVCPTKGISIPDAGAFIEMLKASSGREPDIILGKPYSYMADFLICGMGVEKNQTVMVGDRLYTDIMFGKNAGILTALVLSGETTVDLYNESGISCDFVLKDINQIPELIKG